MSVRSHGAPGAAAGARELLRDGHLGRLVTASGPAPVHYLDDDGQPVVVVARGDAAAADGAATLTVGGRAGLVVLRGRLRRVLGPPDSPDHPLHAVLADHAGCLVDVLATGSVAYSRLELSEVAFGSWGLLRAVPLTAYATAGTDAALVR